MPDAGDFVLVTDIVPGLIQTGTVSVAFSSQSSKTASVTFDIPFSAAPTLTCQVVSASGSAIRATILVTALSATGFTIRVDLAGSATVTLAIHWQAIAQT